MTTPDDIHEVLAIHEDFLELLEKIDAKEPSRDLREAITSHGGSTAATYEHECEELDIHELGWLRIAWEAHHINEGDKRVETCE